MEKLKSLQLRIQDNIKEKEGKKLKILLIVIIATALLAASLVIKNIVSNWYWESHGFGFYWTNPELFGQVYEGDVWYLEAYVDASYYYEPYLEAFRFENWNPYAGGPGPLNGYAYGPMFIFGIYFISLIISIFYPQMLIVDLVPLSVKWTHIAFDSLSVVMVYLIVILLKKFRDKDVKKHIFGILTAIIFACMPVNLLYVDSIYLNTPQMTFFTLLSLLLFMKDKYRVGAFILSIAWLSKQMSLFLVIPWFFIVWKKKNLRTAFVDFLFTFLFTTILISLPWIIMTPYSYLRRVFGPGSPLETFVPETAFDFNGRTVTLAHSFLYLGSEGLALFYHNINRYMIPFILFYLLAVMLAYFNGEKLGNDESQLIILSSWILVNTHLFISRGIYKYYNAFLTPFIVLSLLVFFDDIAPKAIRSIPTAYSHFHKLLLLIQTRILKRESEKDVIQIKTKPTTEKILSNVFLMIMFLGFNAFFYYFNWILIINSRFLHPFYLLILFIVVSLLIQPTLYASLIKASSYKMIWTDIVYLYKETVKGFVSFFTSTRKFFLEIIKRTRKLFGKSKQEKTE